MGYKASPRPTFSEPTAIPFDRVTRHLWGDPEAGEVADWIYVSSDKIHQLLFGLPPRGAFRHSDAFRTIFAADEVLYVLSGVMVLSNPQTGEVHRAEPGEAIFFRKDTWHHAFNYSHEPLMVLEYFSPRPSQGTSGAYAQTQPNLTDPSYGQEAWMGQWPMAREAHRAACTMTLLKPSEALWRLEGKEQQTLVGILAATEHLTVGVIEILAGEKTDVQVHDGDKSLYVKSGTLHVHAPEAEGQSWFELNAKDGFYLPAGSPHQFHNMSGDSVEFVFGVAPNYTP